MSKINEFQKWPSDKKQYDINYLKLYGKKCPICGGTGGGAKIRWLRRCSRCNGLGYIEKNK